jgi:coatomer protein complex subunit gamma
MAMQAPPENQSVMGKIIAELKDIRDRHLKDESFEGQELSPFAHLDKSAVLQDCRVFHDANFVRMHPKRCCQQITRLLYFLVQGETFSGPDAEAVFFGVTKLFQSTDGNLRRMVYLFLKAVAESTDSSSLIIVTQSLVKDMFNEVSLYKGNALRVLSSIVDVSMLGQLERYYKQSIVDRDDYVSSAALVSSLLLSAKPGASEVIARWVNEVQTTLSTSKGDMVQFHALALLRSIKRQDKLAVSKVRTPEGGGGGGGEGGCRRRHPRGLGERESERVSVRSRRPPPPPLRRW